MVIAAVCAPVTSSLESLTKRLYEAPGDDTASGAEEGKMNVRAPVVANLHVAEAAMQPGDRAFHDPAVAPQSLLRFDPPAGDAWHDAATAPIMLLGWRAQCILTKGQS
jgi:hypothetical protein